MSNIVQLLLVVLFITHIYAQEFPSAPFVDLTVLSGEMVEADLHAPMTDGGAAITSYKVDWDSNPGVHEVQTVTTSAYTGPNEIQVITSSASVIPEEQVITTSSTEINELQRIRVFDATVGSRFFLMLDTTSTGGSVQYSGYIAVNAANNGSRTSVEDIISQLSNVDGRVNVTKEVVDANTYDYLVTFPLSMGNVPLMVPNTDELEPAGTARVEVSTVDDGNILGGNFRLSFRSEVTEGIPFDATVEEMTTRLQDLSTIGTVTVTRSNTDYQRGYAWTVTFTDPMNSGDVDPISANITGLTVSSAAGVAAISIVPTDGNQLGGTFTMDLNHGGSTETTGAIDFDASASEMKIAIEGLSNVPAGSIAVTRTGPDGQLGYSWTIQFLDDFAHTFSGDVNEFSNIVLSSITGDTPVIDVVEAREGTIKEVQQIDVKFATAYNETTRMSLKLDTEKTVSIPLMPGSGVCESTVTEVQTITSSAVFTQATASQGDGTVSHGLKFRLQSQLTGETTDWISANPVATPDDCSVVATEIETALEGMAEFFNVDVTYVSTPGISQGCTWSVSFISSQGNVDQLQVQAKNTYSQYTDPAFSFSSTVGDNTIATGTTTDGELDAIKAALELLPNTGLVSVTNLLPPENGYDCSWQITFDTKAGAGSFPELTMAIYMENDDMSSLTYSDSPTFDADPTSGNNAAVGQVKQITAGTSEALGGYYTLTFRGARTGYLTYDASARDVEEALQILDTVGDVAVTRSSSDENKGFTWSVTFLTEMGDLDTMLFDHLDLTGTVANGVVAEDLKGVFPPFNSLDQVNNLPLGSAVITNLDDLQLRVSELEQGIAYYFRASAMNSIGQGPFGYSTIPFAIPEPQRPSAPSSATVEGMDGTSVRVGFDSPPLDGGPDVTFYKIEYGNEMFVSEVQQVSVLCDVVNEVQEISTSTDNSISEVQLLHLHTSWGGGSAVNEKQLVQCDASGGTFRLEFAGTYTPPILYTASATDVQAALEQIDIINSVAVTFTGITTACDNGISGSDGFTVEFISVTNMAGNLPLLTSTTNSLSGLRRIDVSQSVRGDDQLGGTLRLSFRGSISQDIDVATLDAATLATRLGEIDTIPAGGVTVTAGTFPVLACDNCQQYRITFTDANLQGDIEAIEIVSFYNHVTGSDHAEYIFTDATETLNDRGDAVLGSVQGNQVGGFFTISFRGHTTDPIEYNAADTVMKATIEQLPNIGTVSVVRTGPTYFKEYVWTVTFDSMPGAFPIGSEPLDAMTADYSDLTGTTSTAAVVSTATGSDLLSGTFALTYAVNGSITEIASDIPVDASASQLAAELNALEIMGTVSVTRETLQNGYKWLVTFDGCKIVDGFDVCNEGDVELMIATNSSTCPVQVQEVLRGVGPGACPETTSGECTQLVTDLSGAAPYSYIVSNLVSGSPYYFRVMAHNSIGYGFPSITSPTSIVPTFNSPAAPPPVRLVSSCVTSGCASGYTSITLEWDFPRENGGATVQGFELWMDDWAGGNPRLAFDGTEEPETLSFRVGEDTSLTVVAGKSYRFSVRAINYCLATALDTICYSPFSEEAVFVVRAPRVPLPPPLPYRSAHSTIGAQLIASDSAITIRWAAPQDNGGNPIIGYDVNVAGPGDAVYQVFYQAQAGDARDNQIMEYTFSTSVAEGDVYRFYIVAQNSIGKSAGSPIASIVAAMPPGTDAQRALTYAAQSPVVTAIDSQQITVSWPMPSSNSTGGSPITGYKMYMYPGVGLNTLANPTTVFQEVQTITTSVDPKTPEVQKITLIGLSGNVLVSHLSQTPQSVAVSESQANLESLFDNFLSVAGLSCSGSCSTVAISTDSNGNKVWDVTFTNYDGPLELIAVDSTGATGANANAISSTVERIVSGTSVISGSFTVSYNGTMSVDLDHDVSAVEMKASLEDIPGVGTVSVSRSNNLIGGLDREAYIWTITFEASAGDLPLVYCTAGRLNSLESGVTITPATLVDGTNVVEVYDGTGIPDIRSFTVSSLVSGMTYSFKIAPINAISKGVLSLPTNTVVATSGSSAVYTTVSGSSLKTGITNEVTEQQILRATHCANATITVNLASSSISFLGNATDADVTALLNSLYDSESIEVYRTTTEPSIPNQVVWRILFPGMGDVDLISVTSDMSATCDFITTEFLKGNKNSFTIEPKQASGEVLRDVITASGFEGFDDYFIEMYKEGEWFSDQGTAVYNPVVYEVMNIYFPTAVTSATLDMDDYATPDSIVTFSTSAVGSGSTAREMQVALEALDNIDSVDVTKESVSGGEEFLVTFLSNLGPVPLMTPSDGSVIVTEVTEGVCEVQTITVAADVEMTREKQLLNVVYDNTVITSSNVDIKIEYPPSQSIVNVNFPVTSSQLEAAIASLVGTNGAPLAADVTLHEVITLSSVDQSFEIKFIAPVGDAALLSFTEVTDVASFDIVDIVESVKGASPIDGTYTVFFEGAYTDDILFDASAADVKKALEALPTVGTVVVDREDTGNGYKWTVSFIQNMGNLRMMLADPYRYEVQRIVTTGGSPTPLYGQFTVSYGVDQINVDFDASSEELRASLESLPSIGSCEVSRTASINGQYQWLVTFRSLIGDVGLLGVSNNLLLGSDADINIYEEIAGNNATLTGEDPRLAVLEKTRGRPDYTGEYVVETPGKYDIQISQLISGGLRAKYYDNQWFYGEPSIEQIDSQVDFDWGLSLLTEYSSDYVSASWSGKLKVDKSELYTFYLYADDRAKIYLNHTLLIDASSQCCVENRAEVSLEAGVFYDIVVEYTELTGSASVHLSYSSLSVKRQVIPASKLYYALDVVGSPFTTSVIPGAADYPYTDAYGPGLEGALTGTPTYFYIQTKDTTGNNQSVDFEAIDPIDLLSVTLTGGSGAANTIYYPTIEYTGSGLFKASYLPLNSGNFTANIVMGSNNIQCGLGEENACSPFTVLFEPGPTVPQTSEVESPSFEKMDYLVEAVTGEFGYFYIQAKDAYGNNAVRGGDDFQAVFTNMADATYTYRGNVDDHGDGTYTVHYTIPIAGSYDVAVTLATSGVHTAESLLTCTAASAPYIFDFDRCYNGKITYVTPAFCTLDHPTLLVVHNDIHAPSCTYVDGTDQELAHAITGVENSLVVESRDQFGNLREGDSTANFYGYQDGKSDYFLIEFSQVETGDYVRVSTAIDVISSSSSIATGYFRLSFGGRTTYDIPHDVSAEGLETILEALHDFKLDVVVTYSAPSGKPQWEVMFLTMLNVWQSMPMAGPATGTELTVLAASDADTTFSSTLGITRPAVNGVYPVSFTLWRTGTYMTRVTNNGIDITGSPTTTTVTNAPVDPTSSFATGTGLVGGVAGEPIAIQIQAKDTRKPEVQTVMISGALPNEVINGTFTLGFKGENTTSMFVNATDIEMKDALEALYSIGEVTVVKDVYGGGGGSRTYSIWTISFSGACSSEATCPTSLGDEPLLFANSGNLWYNEHDTLHQGKPTIYVTESAKGYPGNKRLSGDDQDKIEVVLDHRFGTEKIGMNEVMKMTCTDNTGLFTIQFLNQTIELDASYSTAQFKQALELEFKNVYDVTTQNNGSTICVSGATQTTEIFFDTPRGQALPLPQIVFNDSPDTLSVYFETVVDGVDSVATLDPLTGLYEIVYTPTYKGVYDVTVAIDGVNVATNFKDGVFVTPAQEYSASSTHNISQVNIEAVREYFTIQFRDRFGNTLDSGVMGNSQITAKMTGKCDICQSDKDSEPADVEIPLSLMDRDPYTDGIYSFHYDPTAAGSYEIAVELMTQGGLLATYYKTTSFEVPVLASVVNFHDDVYHDPYWCDGIRLGNFSRDWKFGPATFCDLTIEDCGCDSTRLDSSIDFSWGDQSPLPYDALVTGKFPNDYFSVAWDGHLMAPGTGEYTFEITADYGVVFELNGKTLLDQTPVSSKTTLVTASLVAGEYNKLHIAYIHQKDEAYIRIAWSGPGVEGKQTISSDSLYYSRHIINSPVTVQVYPGEVESLTSSATGSGLTQCTSMVECSFVIQARDGFANNIFNDGAVDWNISLTGFGDWAGYEPHEVYRINDVNHTGYAHVAPTIEPLAWDLIGNANIAFADYSLTSLSDFTSTLERGDTIKVGEEVLMVELDETDMFNASMVPISRPYLGDDLTNVEIYKLSNCTTGKYLVTYTPVVRGFYTVNILTRSVDEVQYFEIYADGNLGGSFTLTPSAMVEGYMTAKTTNAMDLSTVTAVVINDELEALDILETVTVSDFSLTASECVFKVTFHSMDQDLPMVVIDSAAVTGNDVFTRVTADTEGMAASNIIDSPFTLDVEPAVTSGPYTRADGQGLLYGETGVESTFSVQSKDAWGNDRRHSQEQDIYKIHAFLADRNYYDANVSITGSYRYLQDGLYHMDYTPITSGTYTLVVMLADTLEVQNITANWANLAARTGYFQLSYGCALIPHLTCVKTKNLAWDADAEAVQEAIEGLPGVGEIEVKHTETTDKLQAAWEITFLSACDMLELTLHTTVSEFSIATSTAGDCSHISTTTDVNISNTPVLNSLSPPYVNDMLVEEQQKVEVWCDQGPNGCSFKLSFRGVLTPFVYWDVNVGDLQTALNDLITIGSVEVTGTVASGTKSEYLIQFLPSSGNGMGHLENYGDLTDIVVVSDLSSVHSAPLQDSSGSAPFYAVTEMIKGVSPFSFFVEALAINAAHTTAVHSLGVPGSSGLTTGIYLDSSSFVIESRDVFDNRVLKGPVNEVQIIETYTEDGSDLSGSFVVSYKGHSVELGYNAGIGILEAALESLPSIGDVDVYTNSVKIPAALEGTATEGSTYVTGLNASAASLFEVGDWIRLGKEYAIGPVFTVAAVETSPDRLVLSSPYRESTGTVELFMHDKSGYQYIVEFDSNLGDLPDLFLLSSLVDTSNNTAVAKLTACNSREEQVVTTSSSSVISGSFYLTLDEARTPDMSFNVSAETLKSEMENLPGIFTVDVEKNGPNAFEAYSWTISFVAFDQYPSQVYAEGALLQGDDVAISVSTDYCPYTNSTGTLVTSAYGVIGETFMASVSGINTDLYGKVRSNVSYNSAGLYDVTYLTPRLGSYNLTVAKAKRGGLVGAYFNNRWMYGDAVMTRVDPLINFMWGMDDAITETGKDYISIRWTGYILPSFSEVYDISITVNDGVRLWIDDVLLIDLYENEVEDIDGSIVFSASTGEALFANQLSTIKIEYRENTGIATAILSWSSASQPHEIIPSYRLFSDVEEIDGSPYIVIPTGRKPTLVRDVALSINDWDEILVEFVPPADDGGTDIVSYTVEWYSSEAAYYGVPEEQTITITDNVVGGTFTLFGPGGAHEYEYAIPFDVTDGELEEIIERLPSVGDVTVTTTMSGGNKVHSVVFVTNLGNVGELAVSGSGFDLEDSSISVNIAVATTVNGTTDLGLDGGFSSGGFLGVNANYSAVVMDIGSNPTYSYLITGVDQDSATTDGYYVRVSATNQEGFTSIPTKVLNLKPMALPDAPDMTEVLRAAGSDESLMVYWTFIPYPMDRASPVTHFVVQWSEESDFSVIAGEHEDTNSNYLSERINVDTSLDLAGETVHKYNITSLTPGNTYYVRVCAVNIMGRGEFTNALFNQFSQYSIQPRGKADAIIYGSGVQISTIPASHTVSVLESCSSLKVTFNAPEDTHGSVVHSYKLEWWVDDYVQEVKTLRVVGSGANATGTFLLKYDGDKTDFLHVDSSSDVVRTALESLTSIRSVQVKRTAVTDGFDWAITFLQDFPSVHNLPLEVDESQLEGTGTITTNTPGVLPQGYNHTMLDATVSVSSYSHVIQNLETGFAFKARVSALNEEGISIGQNSFPAELAPPIQKPSEPLDVSLHTYSASALKVMYKTPESNGGDKVTKYKIEWDLSQHFNSSAGTPTGSQHKMVSGSDDCTDLHCSYVIHSLEKGVEYYVRVFSYNALGYSESPGLPVEISGKPITQPSPPAAVSVTSTDKQSLVVTIDPPTDDGGAAVQHYKVEWDVLGAEAYDTVVDSTKSLLYSPYTVQVIQSEATLYDLDGYFYVGFAGFVTEQIDVEATAADLESALKALPTTGDISVVRTERKENFGYDWTVTFHNSDWMNSAGKLYEVPSLGLSIFDGTLPSEFNASVAVGDTTGWSSNTFTGTNGRITVSTLVEAMAGYAQQSITVTLTQGTMGGTFALQYKDEMTPALSANASSTEIKIALGSIQDLSEVLVRRQTIFEGGEGFTIYLTFVENLGPIDQVSIDIKNLKKSVAGVTPAIQYQNHVVGQLPVMESRYYGSAIVADSSTYEIPGLERGLDYHVRVSAWNGAGAQYGQSAACIPALHRTVTVPILGDAVNLVNMNDKSLQVNWNVPTDIGGADITEYMVEYDTAPVVTEIQSVSIRSTSSSITGSFCLAYEGFSTSNIPYDASANRLASALESLANIGSIEVSRDVSNAGGQYEINWLVTFKDNVGDLSDVTFSCNHLVGGTVSTAVKEITAGQAMTFKGGSVGIITMPLGSSSVVTAKAVQKITVNTTSTDINGQFFVKNMGEVSKPIDVYSSAAEVETILEDMLTIDDVEVSMVDLDLASDSVITGYGRSWLVTFSNAHYESLLVITGAGDADVVSAGAYLRGTQAMAFVERVVEEAISPEVTIEALNSGSGYVSRVKAFNGHYWSNYISTPISLAPSVKTPDSPADVYMRAISDSQISVAWNAPENNGGATITGYSVQWSSPGASFGLSSNNAFVSAGSSYVISGLTAGTDYKVRVAAYNSIGYSPYAAAQMQFQWSTVQTVNIAHNVLFTNEVFTLTFNDGFRTHTTGDLSMTASEEEVRDALQLLDPISTVLVKKFDQSAAYDNNSTDAVSVQYRIIFVSALFEDANQILVVGGTGATQMSVVINNVGANVLSSFVKPIVTQPSAPENIRLVSVSTTELGVFWDAPLLNGGVPISKFLIEWDYGPYFMKANESAYHDVIGENAASLFNLNHQYAYQITNLPTQNPVFVRVSAMNEAGHYSYAKQAWPLNSTDCDTMPTHCSLTPTTQILYKVVNPAVALSFNEVANRLDVTWTQPKVDFYGFSSDSSSYAPSLALYTRFEWDTDAQFSNPTAYDRRMILNDDIIDKCESPCTTQIGVDVQNVTLVSENDEDTTAGAFALTYVGKHSPSLNVMVKSGMSSITILDTDITVAVGDILRIAGDVYQITATYANGGADLHVAFHGGFTDVTVAYHASRPTTCVDHDVTAANMDAYLETILVSQNPLLSTFVEVAAEPLNKGKSWLVTFTHTIFQDEVDNLVLFPPTGSVLAPPACATQFSTASGSTYLVAASVTKNAVAGSLLAGTPVFVRLVPINYGGIGPDNLAIPN